MLAMCVMRCDGGVWQRMEKRMAGGGQPQGREGPAVLGPLTSFGFACPGWIRSLILTVVRGRGVRRLGSCVWRLTQTSASPPVDTRSNTLLRARKSSCFVLSRSAMHRLSRAVHAGAGEQGPCHVSFSVPATYHSFSHRGSFVPPS